MHIYEPMVASAFQNLMNLENVRRANKTSLCKYSFVLQIDMHTDVEVES